MMRKPILILCISVLFTFAVCCKSSYSAVAYESEDLKIISLSKNTFIHISYLNIPDVGTFPCNGIIYMNEGKAAVFDTPADPSATEELLKWIIQVKQQEVTAVVINHFHDDCLAGLETFHKLGIPSFANERTIKLAQKGDSTVPQIGFTAQMELEVGNKKIINRYFGEAHTPDNIVSYIPEEKLIFGGCMVKSVGAQKGNTADANLEEWGSTVSKIKTTYPNVKFVVPGHGNHGDRALLEYTIQLFSYN